MKDTALKDKDPYVCSTVKPWNVPTKFFEANREAMVTRAKWLPLIYTATREAYDTGVSLLRPMYVSRKRAVIYSGWVFFLISSG